MLLLHLKGIGYSKNIFHIFITIGFYNSQQPRQWNLVHSLSINNISVKNKKRQNLSPMCIGTCLLLSLSKFAVVLAIDFHSHFQETDKQTDKETKFYVINRDEARYVI